MAALQLGISDYALVWSGRPRHDLWGGKTEKIILIRRDPFCAGKYPKKEVAVRNAATECTSDYSQFSTVMNIHSDLHFL